MRRYTISFLQIFQTTPLKISESTFLIITMRTIDTAKRDKVIQTVLQITMEEGLAALSFDKLAKRAGISSGTPYVYYKDKTDMLSCIYAQVWQGLQEGLQQAIDMGRTPGEKLFFGLRQLAQTLLTHPQEAHFFLSVVNAPEFVTAEALQENSLPSPPLMAVYQEAIARRLMKTDNVAYINAVLFGPLFLILQQHRQSGTPAVMSEVEKVLDLSVSAVLKIR